MRRIAVINQKGGVGKTTTTANLGAALAQSGMRVLLIDLDPQAHLSLHFGVELNDHERSVYDVLTGSIPIADVARDVRDNVTLVPADIDLCGVEAELVSVTGREVLLREALDALGDRYDDLLMDCPPSLGILTVNALAAADEVLIPLQAHFLALQGLSKLLGTVSLVRQRINPKLKVGGIALCMHESSTRLAGEVVEDLVRFLDSARGRDFAWSEARLYQTRIRRNIKLAESSSFGQTVFEYAPRSNGAADYTRLAAEVFGDHAASLCRATQAGGDGDSRFSTMKLHSNDKADAGRDQTPSASTPDSSGFTPNSNNDASEATITPVASEDTLADTYAIPPFVPFPERQVGNPP